LCILKHRAVFIQSNSHSLRVSEHQDGSWHYWKLDYAIMFVMRSNRTCRVRYLQIVDLEAERGWEFC